MTTRYVAAAACLAALSSGARTWAAEGESGLAAAKTLCRQYVQGFLSPDTNLLYGKRINGPKGARVLESPEAIRKGLVRGKPKPYGYGAGVEDVAYQNATVLFALCDAHEATGDAYFGELARRVFKGLKLVGTVSPVPGFVPRGPHPDGKSYYADSSLDQHSLYVCGLWRYFHSALASDADKAFIREWMDKFARRMEKNKWTLLVEDDSRVAHVGWCWLGMTRLNAEIMLSMLGAVQDVTGTTHWRQEYERFGREANAKRWTLLAQPVTRLPRYTLFSNQNDFRLVTLARMERDPERKAVVGTLVRRRARELLTGDFFTLWRRLDWIGKRPDPVVEEFLKPVGLSLTREATVFDIWDRPVSTWRSPKLSDGTHAYYQALLLRSPISAWQTALLSADPELVARVHARIPQVYKKVDMSREWGGFTASYTAVLVLLDVAAHAGK